MAQNFLSDIKLGDDIYIRLGDATNGDLQIYHDGANSVIADKGTGHLLLTAPSFRLRNDAQTEEIITADEDGAVKLYYDGSKRIETTSAGVTVTGDVTISANTPELLFADTDNNTDAKLLANNGNVGIFSDINQEYSDSIIYFNIDGTERARFDGSGYHFRPGADSTYDLGLDATRWRNVYADNYHGDGSNLTGVAADESRTIILTVKNKSGGSLSKGTLVHASPSATPPSGNIIEVVAAENDVEASMPALGVLNETLANEAEGECVVLGSISGISTTDDGTSTGTLFTVGDFLYVSDTAGLFTNVKPTGTKLIQKIGIVIKAHATNGTVEVFGAGRTNDVPTPLYIDHANQEVGIGQTSPDTKLHITDTSSAFQFTADTGTAGDGRLNIGHFANGTFIGTYGDDGGAADLIRFGTHSGDERMRIDSDGTITFNAYTTAGLLQVNSSGVISTDTNTYLTTSSASSTYLPLAGGTLTGDLTLSKASTPIIKVEDTTNNHYLFMAADDNNSFMRSDGTLLFQVGAASSTVTALNFASDGDAIFAGQVTINEGDAFTDLNIKSDRTGTSANIGGLNFVNNSDAIKSQIFADRVGNIKIASGGQNVALSIDSSQNATFAGGITTTSTSGLNIDTTGNALAILDGDVGSTQALIFKNSGTEVSRISHAGNDTSLVLYTGSSVQAALTLDSSQNATFAGGVTIDSYTGLTVDTIVKLPLATSLLGTVQNFTKGGATGPSGQGIIEYKNFRDFPTSNDNSKVLNIAATSGVWGQTSHAASYIRFSTAEADTNTTEVLLLGPDNSATFAGRVKGTNFTSVENSTDGGFSSTRDYLLAGTGDRGGGLIINDISGARFAMYAGGYDLTFTKEKDDGAGTLSQDIWMRANAADAASNVSSIDFLKDATFAGSVETEGPDGGLVLRSWTGNAVYGSLATVNMSGTEYALLTDGADTFISGGSGGSTHIRGGGNHSTHQLKINSGGAEFFGNVNIDDNLAVNFDYDATNTYLLLRKHQSNDGGIVFQSKTSGGSTQSDFQVLNHGTTGDLKFYAYGLADHALTLDRENGNATFAGAVDAVNFKINGAQGTDGQVLTSTGSGVAWEDAAGGSFNGGTVANATTFSSDVTFADLIQVYGPGNTTRADTHGISFYGGGNTDYRISFDSIGGTVGYMRYNVDTAGSSVHGHMFSAGDFSGTPTDLMIIRADGNVGIGDTDPAYKLTVEDSVNDDWISRIYNTNTNGAGLLVRTDATSANDKIALGVYADSGYKMVVRSTGDVGIGTTSPDGKLHIANAGETKLDIEDTGGQDYRIFARASDNVFGIYDKTNSRTWFRHTANATASSQKLALLETGGSVGIGTNSPQEKLHIFNSSSAWNQFANIRLSTENDSFAAEVGFHRGTANDSNRGLFLSGDGTNKHLHVGYTGLVGIGTDTPQAPLHVIAASTANDALIQEWSYGSTMQDQYSLMLKQTVTSGVVRYNFSMVNNNTSYNNVLVLDRGNVGIGVTSPETKLQVNGGVLLGSTYAQPAGSSWTTSNSQLILGGAHNAEFNDDNPGVKLLITGHNNDGTTLYPIYVEDENGLTDFYLKNRSSQANLPSAYFGGDATFVGGVDIDKNTNSTSALRLKNGDISTGVNSKVQIQFGFNGTTDYSHYIVSRHNSPAGSTAGEGNALDFYVGDTTQSGVYPTNATHNLTLDGGNVGINQTSPSSKLHITNDAGGSGGYLKVTDVTYGGDVRFGMADGINNDAVLGTYTNNGINFVANSVQHLRIGTVGHTMYLGGTTSIYQTSNRATLKLQGSASSLLEFATDTESIGYIYGTSAGLQMVATGSDYIQFYTNNTQRVEITNGGNVEFKGNITLDSSTTSITGGSGKNYADSDGAVNLAAGWYTIATNTGDRAQGRFRLIDLASSRHQAVEFQAAHHYGQDTSNAITVTTNSYYGTAVFTAIRIKDRNTYDGAALQVYIANSTNQVGAYLIDQADTTSGWVIKDWVADATDPGDLTSYSGFTPKSYVDLSLIANHGGIATSGNIISQNIASPTTFKHIQVAPSTDYGLLTAGRAQVGKIGFNNYAGFKHHSPSSSTGYAMLQSSSGSTFVNAASGARIYFRNNNSDVGQWTSTTLTVNGALSKGSGSFKIDHPLESKKDTHHLVHSFIEGPQADLIYRGKVTLTNGRAEVNIDREANMTQGTFVALNTNVQCFTTNESNWDLVKGSVSGNILTIESQNTSSTATISWMVVGERQDQHMIDTDWTDSNGKVIVEPYKVD